MIRAYARHLGLDPEPLVDEYDDRVGGRRDDVPAPPVNTSSRRARAGTRPVMRRRRRDTRWAWLSAGAVLGAAVLVWIGASREPAPVTPLAPLPDGAARTTRTVTAPPVTTAPSVPPPAAPARQAGVLRLEGVDGGSWVQVRRGAADGEVLYEGTLAAGASRRFPVGERLWVRLGWGSGVRATVGGRAATLPEGTGDVVVTRRGVVAAPA